MVENKLIWTLFMTNWKFSKEMGPQSDVDLEEMRAVLFQNVIGSLVYAMVYTRPNIANVVGVVSHFMANLG